MFIKSLAMQNLAVTSLATGHCGCKCVSECVCVCECVVRVRVILQMRFRLERA